ncbi:hypothetical protein TVAG_293270 [Trichomonas vaginalis G3]|uniref:Uncharacterized protein n=1 Tax=Trichomonas vaginalis (strain ATCC PRA-98 / G3) TaxID=412133 RepID=A2GEL4_TRIV3|nr:uncharacterized protein TVAGG3_1084500 [Trichomonas vaginalis G3]EAX84402.1 hypothetical protein TVAG_293270 [Trichomonas vaginalis G3]KAI5482543.1 hypothetical protein TVAGG3_1084500 [Trichomonas vaginalis G3]|eukprot:XP_001297332.1 hypothetical protein [Trichomonas vaginalis G3]
MSHVPPTQSILNPEEPKAPAPAPQFQQFQSQSKLLPIPISIQIEERPRVRRRSEPLTQRVCYSSNPWLFQQFQSQSKLLPISIQIEEGLNRLRKEYATAPIERKLLLNSVKIMFR